MLKRQRLRRPLALLLIVLGGLLMFLAAEVWAGVLTLILGVGLELLGIHLERQDARLPKS